MKNKVLTVYDLLNSKIRRFMISRRQEFINKEINKLDDNKKVIFNLCLNLINNSKTEMRIAPITNYRYMINNETFIEIGYSDITVFIDDDKNREFYSVYLNLALCAYLTNKFDRKTENHRMFFKKQKLKKVNNHLNSLMEK